MNVNGSAEANWTIPQATDNSDIAPAVNVTPPGVRPPFKFNETTVVTYTASDTNGNTAICMFRIRVEGKKDDLNFISITGLASSQNGWPGGLMISVLSYRSSGLDSSPGLGTALCSLARPLTTLHSESVPRKLRLGRNAMD